MGRRLIGFFNARQQEGGTLAFTFQSHSARIGCCSAAVLQWCSGAVVRWCSYITVRYLLIY